MNNLAHHAPDVNCDEADHYRPTAGAAFIPSPEDESSAAALLNADCHDGWPVHWPDPLRDATINDWDYRAKLAYQAERIASGPLL